MAKNTLFLDHYEEKMHRTNVGFEVLTGGSYEEF
jgi:hypothetical protein